mmetsp:Transcript_21913/g.46573  ORF Transcript_21913/g.46573 Transcript_21913/m.46573 type:complete len:355 (-) Transcript_21913:11-1075(-)
MSASRFFELAALPPPSATSSCALGQRAASTMGRSGTACTTEDGEEPAPDKLDRPESRATKGAASAPNHGVGPFLRKGAACETKCPCEARGIGDGDDATPRACAAISSFPEAGGSQSNADPSSSSSTESLTSSPPPLLPRPVEGLLRIDCRRNSSSAPTLRPVEGVLPIDCLRVGSPLPEVTQTTTFPTAGTTNGPAPDPVCEAGGGSAFVVPENCGGTASPFCTVSNTRGSPPRTGAQLFGPLVMKSESLGEGQHPSSAACLHSDVLQPLSQAVLAILTCPPGFRMPETWLPGRPIGVPATHPIEGAICSTRQRPDAGAAYYYCPACEGLFLHQLMSRARMPGRWGEGKSGTQT